MRCATALRPSARASAWTARSWSRVVARHASVLTDPVMQVRMGSRIDALRTMVITMRVA